MQPYNQKLKPYSHKLRCNMTQAEIILWARLRNKKMCGMQFYRQKILLNYIVDFYCPQASLIIECDGSQHYTAEGLVADQIRDTLLKGLGLTVLRFTNHQILKHTQTVCEQIHGWINAEINPNKGKIDKTLVRRK